MRSRTEVVENGKERSLVVEVPRGSSKAPRPDPEIPERTTRRRFTAQYNLRILELQCLPFPHRRYGYFRVTGSLVLCSTSMCVYLDIGNADCLTSISLRF